jgi:hypothetical protein
MQLLFTPSIEDDKCAFLEKAARRACSNTRAAPVTMTTLSLNLFMIPPMNVVGVATGRVQLSQATKNGFALVG